VTAQIDLARLQADIEEINRIGTVAGLPGVNRPSFSDRDMAARDRLRQRMMEAGLETWIDAAGNVFGRWVAGHGAAVLAGSHLDSVPMGGPLDGTLGVCAALEGVRALRASGFAPVRPIVVVATSEEEGRFGGMLGAQAICGMVEEDWLRAAKDSDGVRLTEAMRAQALDPEAIPGAAWRPGDIAAFLELHVEQGPVLEAAGDQVGIVEGISGVFNWTVTLEGQSNHAGTTPMDLRQDAFRVLADFGHAIAQILSAVGGGATRLTVGKVELSPNFPHTVPGRAVFSLIGRAMDEAVMRALDHACRTRLAACAQAHGVTHAIEVESWLAPTLCDPAVIELLTGTARDMGLRARRMPSGAGHDTQMFAKIAPAGLIFVPSLGGVSHAPEEETDPKDIENGANLLTRAIAALAAR